MNAPDPSEVTANRLPGGPIQPLPAVTALSEPFWRGGERGELRLLRCDDCGTYVHPPRPVCPSCLCGRLHYEAVSGRGTLYSFTIDYQPWYPGHEVPYAVALVELPEQAALRLTTNIVGCDPESLEIGMPVEVRFVAAEDVWLPVFAPAARSNPGGRDG